MTSHINDDGRFTLSAFQEIENSEKDGSAFIDGILNASLDGIFVCSAIRNEHGKIEDLRMLIINPAFTRIRKIEKKDVIGKTYLSVFPSAKDIGMFDFYCKVIETSIPSQKEFHYIGPEVNAWFEVSAVKFGVDGLVVTFHDFTNLKMLQSELEQNIIKLENSNKNLEYFTFASSHDLKEPLRKVMLNTDQLKRKYAREFDSEGTKYLNGIQAGVERMTKLVDDLLTYSEISLNTSKPNTVDLNEVISEVITDLELHFIEKKATIHVDLLPALTGNQRQLYQLFINVIENSLKFSIKDLPVEINITSEKVIGKHAAIALPPAELEKLFYQVSITDNGIGFDEHYVQRIFNVFQRLNSRFPGTGLGLAIAYKVMENHNGWINASSKEGKGTIVTLIFPAIGNM
jgi:signal transduction histidine kinase